MKHIVLGTVTVAVVGGAVALGTASVASASVTSAQHRATFTIRADHTTIKKGQHVRFTGIDGHHAKPSSSRIYCLVEKVGKRWYQVGSCTGGRADKKLHSVTSSFTIAITHKGKHAFRVDAVNPRTHKFVQAPTAPITITVK